jgi:diguanylate cyclase (GGDEF)-like protein
MSNEPSHREQALMRFLLRGRGFPAAATLTLLSVVLSVALCSPVILLLLAQATTRETQQLVLLVLAGVVPLVVAPLSLLPLLHVLGKLEDARSQLRDVASIDSLTGALNRATFFERAAIEWAQAVRHDMPLSAVMLDADYFKRLNDSHGHAFGDQALKAMAAAIRRALRGGDIFARYGGEEFIALLPMTDSAGARSVARRIVDNVRSIGLTGPRGEAVSVTVSAGVATRDASIGSLAALLGLADRALYAAKASGRNRAEEGESTALSLG